MKLLKMEARNYRSLRETSIAAKDITLFIGPNASGKSSILDSLRFLSEVIRVRDFGTPVFSRGGFLNLAWKGQDANFVSLTITVEENDTRYDWTARLVRQEHEFFVEEQIHQASAGSPSAELLKSINGEGQWWSGKEKRSVTLQQGTTSCALSAASADASFAARRVSEFVGRWGFFDPSPFLLRRDTSLAESTPFDAYGRNLAERLYYLQNSSPELFDRVVAATRSVVGLPKRIEVRESEDRCYFIQHESGLKHPVHQMGVSSGTLRILALMTAIYGQPGTTLVGIEEPENYVHPTAIESLVGHIQEAEGIQFMVTTHSPLLLDCLGDPEAVSVVRRDPEAGTTVSQESDADSIRKGLDESGFGLGEYYATEGFGS